MKVNFKYAFAALAAITAISCSNDDDVVNGSGEVKTAVIKISQPATRTVGSDIADQTVVTLEAGKIYFYNNGGIVTNVFTIAATGGDFTVAQATDAAGIKVSVDASSTAVAVIGNSNASTVTPGSLVSAAEAIAIEAKDQKAENNINLYGKVSLTAPGNPDDPYTAAIILAPTVARFEITDITAAGKLESFNVEAIFMDEFYKKATVTAALDIADFKDKTNDSDDYAADGSGAYPTDWSGALYDAGPFPITTTASVPEADKLWGYYVLSVPYNNATGSTVPRIILRITDVVINSAQDPNGDLQAAYGNKTWFVTVAGFKVSGAQLTEIRSGNVYNLGTGALTIKEEDLKEEPNQGVIDVDMTITPLKWTTVAVTPDLE